MQQPRKCPFHTLLEILRNNMWYSTYQSKEVHTLLKILRRKQLFSLQLENAPAPMAIISPIGNLSLHVPVDL